MNDTVQRADTTLHVSTTPALVAQITNVIKDTVSIEHAKAPTPEITAIPMTTSAAVEQSDIVSCD